MEKIHFENKPSKDEIRFDNLTKLNSSQFEQLDTDESKSNNIKINKFLVEIAQQLVVPMFFSLIATVFTYTITALTTCFDSMKTYCLVTSIYINLN